jgi:hypothetical protein
LDTNLDLRLQELTGSVSSYFTSIGTGMWLTILIILIVIGFLYFWRPTGPATVYPQPAGPVIIQTPTPAQAAAAAPALQALPAQYYRQQQRRLRQAKRTKPGCWGQKRSSDKELAVGFKSDRKELEFLRARYDFEEHGFEG